jgi:acyl-CoA synthetase (AMP-forming)/AMP-acid ligase II
MNIGELYTLNSASIGDKPAVIYKERVLSHQAFEQRTNQLAQALYELGYRKGDRIAILSKNHIEYPVIIFAAAKIGVVFTPINYRMVGREIISILNHCKPRGLFFSGEFMDRVDEIRDRVGVRDYFLFLENEAEQFPSGKFLRLDEIIAGQPGRKPDVAIEDDDTYYIGYTSGTTGKPKGAIVTHRSRYMLAMIKGVEYGIRNDGIQLVAGPIYHSAPHGYLMTQLVLGGTAVIMKEFDAEEALRLIDRYRITNMFMAPTMYNFILTLDDEVKLKYDLGSVRTLVSAGAPLPTRVKEGIIRLFPNAGLNEFYGSTESGFNTNLRPEDQLKTTRSVGKPVLFNDIKILDDDGNPVKPGEVGLIYVKNPYFFKGYLDDEEETRRAFREDGYLTVGDMARQDAEGFIYIVDRKKDMVISGGVNIFPAEIEDVLYQHPGVKEAAVIGIPDEKWGESLKAFIVPRGESLSEQEVIDFCKQHLASYKKPKSVEFLTELPRNPAGKVLKTVLREPYWKDADFKV